MVRERGRGGGWRMRESDEGLRSSGRTDGEARVA